ncbi:unannotated protein [freshwater metagenome]|uniref:Unannotated protein n=1 Tax=freshwater metagenome TaxID=449393 RepID=A0A6J6FW75_9ZZZZ
MALNRGVLLNRLDVRAVVDDFDIGATESRDGDPWGNNRHLAPRRGAARTAAPTGKRQHRICDGFIKRKRHSAARRTHRTCWAIHIARRQLQARLRDQSCCDEVARLTAALTQRFCDFIDAEIIASHPNRVTDPVR